MLDGQGLGSVLPGANDAVLIGERIELRPGASSRQRRIRRCSAAKPAAQYDQSADQQSERAGRETRSELRARERMRRGDRCRIDPARLLIAHRLPTPVAPGAVAVEALDVGRNLRATGLAVSIGRIGQSEAAVPAYRQKSCSDDRGGRRSESDVRVHVRSPFSVTIRSATMLIAARSACAPGMIAIPAVVVAVPVALTGLCDDAPARHGDQRQQKTGSGNGLCSCHDPPPRSWCGSLAQQRRIGSPPKPPGDVARIPTETAGMASPAGFEPTTSPLGGARAIQLCHGDVATV